MATLQLAGLDMSMPGFKAYGDPNGPYNATLYVSGFYPIPFLG